MTIITLPWPPPLLSPNARIHYMKRHKLFQQYKAVCAASFGSQLRRLGVKFDGVFKIEFCPPRRGIDADNAIGACKALFDGMAEATGINDKTFVWTHVMADPVKDGAVRIEIS